MNRIHPRDILGRLGRRDVEIDDDRILAAADEDALSGSSRLALIS